MVLEEERQCAKCGSNLSYKISVDRTEGSTRLGKECFIEPAAKGIYKVTCKSCGESFDIDING